MLFYYKFRWVVRFTENFYNFLRQDYGLGIELASLADVTTNNDNLAIFTFALKSNQELELNKFIQLIDEKIEIVDWVQSNQREFKSGRNFTKIFRETPEVSVASLIDVDMFGLIALSNEQKIDMYSENIQCLYYSFDWVFHPKDLENFVQLYGKYTESEILFYTLKANIDFATCKNIAIGIRLSDKKFVSEIVEVINTLHSSNWRLIDKDTFYKGSPIRGLNNIDKRIKRWTQYTLDNITNKCFE